MISALMFYQTKIMNPETVTREEGVRQPSCPHTRLPSFRVSVIKWMFLSCVISEWLTCCSLISIKRHNKGTLGILKCLEVDLYENILSLPKFHFSPQSLRNFTLVHKLLEFALQPQKLPINCYKLLFIHFYEKTCVFRRNYSSVPFLEIIVLAPNFEKLQNSPKYPTRHLVHAPQMLGGPQNVGSGF